MTSTASLIWYLLVAGPHGGMAVLPSTFDRREQCIATIAEYQKKPPPPGWTLQCIPSASPFTSNLSAE
jgi:hypothetical protein